MLSSSPLRAAKGLLWLTAASHSTFIVAQAFLVRLVCGSHMCMLLQCRFLVMQEEPSIALLHGMMVLVRIEHPCI